MLFNTYPQNPFPPNSENAGGGGSPYVLPVASANTLGGVKVGNNLSIDANGLLSANNQIVDYSTTEHATGQKWIDGREIYSVTVDNTSDLVVQSNTWTDTSLVKGSIDLIIAVLGTSNGGSTFPLAGDKGTTYIRVNSWRNDTISVRYMTFFYVKTT